MKSGKLWLSVCLVAVLALASGCSAMRQLTDPGQPEPAQLGPAGESAPLGRYYDFEDVQVPSDLKLDRNRSILFRVNNFKCGVLVFSENLDAESLINFFVESMTKDNWVLKSSSKYPQTALFFAKKGKTCIIHIMEKTWTTDVEIWVAPAM
jgi:hypothetical protein